MEVLICKYEAELVENILLQTSTLIIMELIQTLQNKIHAGVISVVFFRTLTKETCHISAIKAETNRTCF
jgi:hypothetical protein